MPQPRLAFKFQIGKVRSHGVSGKIHSATTALNQPLCKMTGTDKLAAQPIIVDENHLEFYFPDGNIVLATYSFVFRIHKGILAARSSVFKDMFELFPPLHEDVPAQYTSSSNFAGSDHWRGTATRMSSVC